MHGLGLVDASGEFLKDEAVGPVQDRGEGMAVARVAYQRNIGCKPKPERFFAAVLNQWLVVCSRLPTSAVGCSGSLESARCLGNDGWGTRGFLTVEHRINPFVRWFRGAMDLFIPDHNGSIESQRQTARAVRRRSLADNTIRPIAPASRPGAPMPPDMAWRRCRPIPTTSRPSWSTSASPCRRPSPAP